MFGHVYTTILLHPPYLISIDCQIIYGLSDPKILY